MKKIKCEVFFDNNNYGTVKEALLDVNTGFLTVEDISHSEITSSKKWIDFKYQGQKFKLDICVRNGQLKLKPNKELNKIFSHMSLEEVLPEKNSLYVKKKKI